MKNRILKNKKSIFVFLIILMSMTGMTNGNAQNTDIYSITATANPATGGMVTGEGIYEYGANCTLTATAVADYTFNSWMENGEVVSSEAIYSFMVTGDRELVAFFDVSSGGVHESIDLGLPSGTLWATCNVGANTPEEYGGYFAWGEIQPKDYYNWSTYQYSNGNDDYDPQLTKYCTDGSYGYDGFSDDLTTLLPEDDAATANWGADWRMPTDWEWQELVDNTTIIWTTQNGMNGALFTATNGNSLFLPAAGVFYENNPNGTGESSSYWSNSLNPDNPIRAIALSRSSSEDTEIFSARRFLGYSVRPVHSSTQTVDALIFEPFEEYTVGNKIAWEALANGHDWWSTWTNSPGSSEDGLVADYNGTKCGHLTFGNDQILLLGDKQEGVYDLEFDVLVPEGKNGYFNIMHHYAGTSSTWAMQCYLHMTADYYGSATMAPGHGTVHAGSVATADVPCVYDAWMHFRLNVDIDSDIARYYYTAPGENEVLICEWQWSLDSFGENVVDPTLAAMDFYPLINSATSEFYIDNFSLHPQKKYTRITSSSELEAGAQYLIVGFGEDGSPYAMGYQKANNRHAVGVTENDGVITSFVAIDENSQTEPYEFTLGGSDGVWVFFDPLNNGYLYAVSSTSNYLRTEENLDENGTWNIQIDTDGMAEVTAQGENNRNVMRFNENHGESPLFSCYSSLSSIQAPVALYKAVGGTTSRIITAMPNSAEGGTVTGGGLYNNGTTCTLTASANYGYTFTNWTKNGEVVSTEASYSFIVTNNASYVANFISNEFLLGFSYYDWQSNAGAITRTIAWPDGKVNFAFTTASVGGSFADRGTGIGTYDSANDIWITSEGRVENEKTGFGSIARYGDNGIVVAAHTSTECCVYIIPDKDNIEFAAVERVCALDATYEIAWPNVMTSGANRDIIHVVANDRDNGMIYYFRSMDGGQTWDKQNVILPFMGTDYCSNWASNDCYWMETTEDNCLALVVNNPWSDGMVIYSYDDGDTWERKVFYKHPNPFGYFDEPFYYPRWTSCQWDDQHRLHVLYEFGAVSGQADYWEEHTALGGVAYWNETMPYNIEGTTSSAIEDNLNPGQPFVMDSAYLNNDIYRSWWHFSDASHAMWPEYMGYLAPLMDDGTPEDPYQATGFNIEDLSQHGFYHSGVCGFPVLCKVPGTNEMVAVWSALDENHIDGNGNYYYKIFASYSGDGGVTWSPMVNLTKEYDNAEFVYNQAAVVGRKLIVAAQTDAETGTYIYQETDSDGSDNYYRGFVFDIDELFDTTPQIGQNTYRKITSPSELESGAQYLIVGFGEDGSAYAMGYQRNNNRHAVGVAENNGFITSIVAMDENSQTEPYEFTLGGSDGAWTFFDPLNNGYLYAEGGGNRLKTQNNLTDNSSWNIVFESDGAVVPISNGDIDQRYMRFNENLGNNLPLFSCYRSESNIQTPVYLYMKDEASTILTQTINLSQGTNWFSTNVEITLDDLKAALVAASPGTTITIKSQNSGQTTWNGRLWVGTLRTMDVSRMYMISVANACEITLEGLPIDPAEHPVTISNGPNWIGFPLGATLTVTNAFAGFASPGDIVKSDGGGQATWNGRIWTGQLKNLEPGKGYIYQSAATGSRTFTFPTGAK